MTAAAAPHLQPQVVVVGAGAAGVGAGLALTRLGIPFVILEAKDRIGGRAFTDTASLGHLWDHGCHWFHSADVNPLREIADRIGHGYEPEMRGGTAPNFRAGAWHADSREREPVWRFLDEVGEVGRDVAVAEFIGPDDPLAPLKRHWLSLMTSGAPEDVSALDYGRYDDTHVNLAVRDGYGALIARLARDLPIRLDQQVERIERRSGGVRVHMATGTLDAGAAIVTVSTNVLRDRVIRFEPDLPGDLVQALHDLPCGAYEKVAVAFEGDPFGEFDASFCDIWDNDGKPVNFEIAPFGRPLAIGHIAGNDLRDLLAEGEAALPRYAVDKLVAAFGSDLRRRIVDVATSRWTHDPFIRGGYAHALPGRAAARDTLIEAELAPVYLAGEATHPSLNATAHGAYLTGIAAAHRAAAGLGHADLEPDALWLPSGGERAAIA